MSDEATFETIVKQGEEVTVLILPTTINIMAPRRTGSGSKRYRSPTGTRQQDVQRTFRMNEGRYAAVAEAAEVVGMHAGEFIRSVIYAAANEILRVEKETKARKAKDNTPRDYIDVNKPVKKPRPLLTGFAVPVDFNPYDND